MSPARDEDRKRHPAQANKVCAGARGGDGEGGGEGGREPCWGGEWGRGRKVESRGGGA